MATEVKAKLRYYRQSPRKVRLAADLIRGKSLEAAQRELKFLPKRASGVLDKLLKSAQANARHNHGLNPEELFVKELRIDAGPTLKRFRPRAFGRAFPVRKRTSHITLVLGAKKIA